MPRIKSKKYFFFKDDLVTYEHLEVKDKTLTIGLSEDREAVLIEIERPGFWQAEPDVVKNRLILDKPTFGKIVETVAELWAEEEEVI